MIIDYNIDDYLIFVCQTWKNLYNIESIIISNINYVISWLG